jgi:hypothetical protein
LRQDLGVSNLNEFAERFSFTLHLLQRRPNIGSQNCGKLPHCGESAPKTIVSRRSFRRRFESLAASVHDRSAAKEEANRSIGLSVAIEVKDGA